jgi:hypothetical protein
VRHTADRNGKVEHHEEIAQTTGLLRHSRHRPLRLAGPEGLWPSPRRPARGAKAPLAHRTQVTSQTCSQLGRSVLPRPASLMPPAQF